MSTRTRLTLTKELLASAGERAQVDPSAIAELWSALDDIAPASRFNVSNAAFYFGGVVIISATTWLMTEAWDETNGWFKLGAALVYAAIFLAGSAWLRTRPGGRIPSGLLATAAVCMTPLAVYGLESGTNFWLANDPGPSSGFYTWIKGSWVPLEVATIIAGGAMLRYVRFPFLVAPIAFSGWYLSMDLADYVLHFNPGYSWDERATVSALVGVLLLTAAFYIDRITREDYAFWLYLFGCASFWGGVWARLWTAGEFAEFATLLLGVGFLGASVVLGRRALTVFGALGCFGYLAHLAWDFHDSLSFPIVLTVTGLAIIGLGIWIQTNLPAIERTLNAALPDSVRKLLPPSRMV